MNRTTVIAVVVEGRTEMTFIKNVLAPETQKIGITLTPKPIGDTGGDVRIKTAMKDIVIYLRTPGIDYVTTMFDYYGSDYHWPGKDKVRNLVTSGTELTACEKARIVEEGMTEMIMQTLPEVDVSSKFIPYFQMHEFEALLFSDLSILAKRLRVSESKLRNVPAWETPEEINDNVNTAPSKRVERLSIKDYIKTTHGISIIEEIGLNIVREKCPHFNEWLTKLEGLPR